MLPDRHSGLHQFELPNSGQPRKRKLSAKAAEERDDPLPARFTDATVHGPLPRVRKPDP